MLARRGYHRNATRAAPAETRRRNGADQVFSRLSHPVSHRATSAGGRETAAPLPPWVHRRGFPRVHTTVVGTGAPLGA